MYPHAHYQNHERGIVLLSDLTSLINQLQSPFCDCLVDEPMKHHTSFKIGGPADLYLRPQTTKALGEALSLVAESTLPLTIIGRGSNLLVRECGIRGVVLEVGGGLDSITRLPGNRLVCGAGASLDAVCRFALREGLSGLEFAYGIPGSVGGAVYMNAGAYGGEMVDCLLETEHLDLTGKAGHFTADELAFSYRHSVYSERTDLCITSATLHLTPGEPVAIESRMRELKARRIEKQPLEYPSAGSTFKRPVGGYASELIDRCGLKGLSVGGAMVSEKHAGFLINYHNATADDMLALIQKVQEIVKNETGFILECEVKII